ncbi:carbohydrate ABC transporter permease [Helicobacter jaachi]|uniref:Carbohydrate ABC transporter permease n=1 Tax=Helicobacter jaachi TaxID=1677920 RepID=A0A4U8T9C8_9HELI|nr:carbohydrate ABC transporter permease [Helicobacter jaachi]TLD96335.1 carbohydrate ABC transporter permease [Helicobacter jaachi]
MSAFSIFRHIVLIGIGSVFFFPFLWMVLTSLKPESEIFSNTLAFFPTQWYALQNYTQAFTDTPLLRFLINGVFVTLSILLLQILIAYPCAYALSKHKFWGRNFILVMIVCCLLIPAQAICVPLYLLMYKFGFLDSYMGLIAPYTISVFGIFLMRQFINGIPDDLIHAAKIDGFSEYGIVWKIILPTTIPAIISFAIFSIVAHWNDYFWPLIVLSSTELFTPTLGVVAFRNNEAGSTYGALMAAATIIVLPLIVAYLFAQKYFMQGIASTGMK